MSCHIAPSGPFCMTPQMPQVISLGIASQQTAMEQSSFNIYPNPTIGNFTVELEESVPIDKIMVEIYGIRGETVMTEIFSGERRHEFSLSNQPAGLYFIRIISGNMAESGKIIKQ